MIDLNNMTKRFLLGETKERPNIMAYIQILDEVMSSFKAHTIKEKQKLEFMKQHIREIRRSARKIIEENKMLQEKINFLEEEKEK